MELDPKLVASLKRAIDAMPDDVELRLHLATLLIEGGRREEGIREVGIILQADPANAAALALITGTPTSTAGAHPGAAGPAAGGEPASPADPVGAAGQADAAGPAAGGEPPPQAERLDIAEPASAAADHEPSSEGGPANPPTAPETPDFDWGAAESQLADVLPPRFVTPEGSAEHLTGAAAGEVRPREGSGDPGSAVFDVEHGGLRLADVAGMTDVKQRLEAAFLAPMRNPELRKLYGKSLRGGLLMYGPPGCGKTFIARAVAGELGARFLAVSFADVVDSMLGQSERNIHEIFGVARQNAPCVVFLDEVDAIGQKRTQLRHTPMRAVVNQLLLELDDVTGGNEGVFLLAATNHPWDVDSALRRPGRFDRMLLVLPPDQPARAAIFRYHLRERPVERVDPERLAKLTDGYSGADIAHICESAAELALLDSVRRGEPRMISQQDLESAIRDVRPSLTPWFDAARNVALFANEGGAYDELAAYLKKNRLL
jgi:AAA+ superfamily predicted ATPase